MNTNTANPPVRITLVHDEIDPEQERNTETSDRWLIMCSDDDYADAHVDVARLDAEVQERVDYYRATRRNVYVVHGDSEDVTADYTKPKQPEST